MVKIINLFVNMCPIKILIKFCQYFGRFHKYFGYVDQSFGRFWAFHLVGDIIIHQYIDILTNRFTECKIILKTSINSIISQKVSRKANFSITMVTSIAIARLLLCDWRLQLNAPINRRIRAGLITLSSTSL